MSSEPGASSPLPQLGAVACVQLWSESVRRPRPRWRIKHDLFWSRFFAGIAGEQGRGDLAELYDDLARLYFELTASCRTSGNALEGYCNERRAISYAERMMLADLPPADAMVLSNRDVFYARTIAQGSRP